MVCAIRPLFTVFIDVCLFYALSNNIARQTDIVFADNFSEVAAEIWHCIYAPILYNFRDINTSLAHIVVYDHQYYFSSV